MAAEEFDPRNCPVGITNSKDIENLGDKLDMAIERLTEKVGEMREDITTLSSNIDEKFEKVDSRFDEMNLKIESIKDEIPQRIDEELERLKGKKASKAWAWIFVGVGGSAIIYIVSRAIAKVLGL